MSQNNHHEHVSILHDIVLLWRYLGNKRLTQLILLFALMLITALSQVIYIGSVVPFLTALVDPDALLESERLTSFFSNFNANKPSELVKLLTIGFVLSALFSSIVQIALLWAIARITFAMSTQLRSDLYSRVLHQPYEYHAAHNSSDLISLTTEKVSATIVSGIMQVLNFARAMVVCIGITLALFLVDVAIAAVTFSVLGGGYLFIGFLAKRRIHQNSHTISELQPQAVKCMQEGIGGIRDVILDSSQGVFSQVYSDRISPLLKAITQNIFLAGLPKPILEFIGIATIAILAYWMEGQESQGDILPVFGALALGAQRLLPSLQQLYSSWSDINSNKVVIHDVLTSLHEPISAYHQQAAKVVLPLRKEICLQQLSFSHIGSESEVLQGVNLVIPKGYRIGLIGETGSGKSTILDIIMGLLHPSSGQLLVDGQVIDHSNLDQWQMNIAHVPQAIFLSDTTLTENIAFGVPNTQVDHELVHFAAQRAQIASHIESLPEGYQTLVGERGIRLSGGQRQRIGIARALYKQAKVIVFDEATSALDNGTESNVMAAIDSLGDELTIIIVAHRLSTLRKCDAIYRLDKGLISMVKNL